MKVAIIGGTGFIGSYVVDQLVDAGHEPRLLVRRGSEAKVRHPEKCRIVTGDLTEVDRVRETIAGCDAAVYLVGILREDPARGVTFEAMQQRGAESAIDVAREAGVRRFVLLSANGVHVQGCPYQQTKWQAEQYLKSSGLAATVLRPSVVFGDPRGRMEFCTQLRDQMIRPPVPAPLFFDGLAVREAGRFKLSPIHVRDVARVLVQSLGDTSDRSDTLTLCGPRALEWREIIRTIAAATGGRKLALPVPAAPVRIAARLLGAQRWFPITEDQIDMLLAGNSGDSSAVFSRFGIEPASFDAEHLAYLRG